MSDTNVDQAPLPPSPKYQLSAGADAPDDVAISCSAPFGHSMVRWTTTFAGCPVAVTTAATMVPWSPTAPKDVSTCTAVRPGPVEIGNVCVSGAILVRTMVIVTVRGS